MKSFSRYIGFCAVVLVAGSAQSQVMPAPMLVHDITSFKTLLEFGTVAQDHLIKFQEYKEKFDKYAATFSDAVQITLDLPDLTQLPEKLMQNAKCLLPTKEQLESMLPGIEVNFKELPSACGLSQLFSQTLWSPEEKWENLTLTAQTEIARNLKERRINVHSEAVMKALSTAEAKFGELHDLGESLKRLELLNQIKTTSMTNKLAVNNELLVLISHQLNALLEIQARQTKLLAAGAVNNLPPTAFFAKELPASSGP